LAQDDQQVQNRWWTWGFAALLHVAGFLLITVWVKPVILPAPPKVNPIQVVILLPPEPDAESEPETEAEPETEPEPESAKVIPTQADTKPEEIPSTPPPMPQAQRMPPLSAPKPEDPQARQQAAASMLFLPAPSGTEETGTAGFLDDMDCRNLERDEPKCQAYREALGNVEFAYGEAVMRDGAAIGAKYRLLDKEELTRVFGTASRYVGPPTPLKDSSMDTMVGSADEMRDRLSHWPPDPVFGD
jgi:hypothetical protein